jgi:hypothetical protein
MLAADGSSSTGELSLATTMFHFGKPSHRSAAFTHGTEKEHRMIIFQLGIYFRRAKMGSLGIFPPFDGWDAGRNHEVF